MGLSTDITIVSEPELCMLDSSPLTGLSLSPARGGGGVGCVCVCVVGEGGGCVLQRC